MILSCRTVFHSLVIPLLQFSVYFFLLVYNVSTEIPTPGYFPMSQTFNSLVTTRILGKVTSPHFTTYGSCKPTLKLLID